MEKEYIVNGKKYGWIKDSVFKKRVNSRKHKMRMLDSYGFEESLVKDLDSMGITEIRIKEDDTGNVFSVPYELFKEKRFLKNFQTSQYFLQMKYFTKL